MELCIWWRRSLLCKRQRERDRVWEDLQSSDLPCTDSGRREGRVKFQIEFHIHFMQDLSDDLLRVKDDSHEKNKETAKGSMKRTIQETRGITRPFSLESSSLLLFILMPSFLFFSSVIHFLYLFCRHPFKIKKIPWHLSPQDGIHFDIVLIFCRERSWQLCSLCYCIDEKVSATYNSFCEVISFFFFFFFSLVIFLQHSFDLRRDRKLHVCSAWVSLSFFPQERLAIRSERDVRKERKESVIMIMLGNEWGKKLWQNERRQQEKSWRKERKFLAQEKKYQEEDREEIVLSPSSSFCSLLSSPSTLFSSCTFLLHWLLYTFNTGREQVECLLKQMEERETKKILWKQDKESNESKTGNLFFFDFFQRKKKLFMLLLFSLCFVIDSVGCLFPFVASWQEECIFYPVSKIKLSSFLLFCFFVSPKVPSDHLNASLMLMPLDQDEKEIKRRGRSDKKRIRERNSFSIFNLVNQSNGKSQRRRRRKRRDTRRTFAWRCWWDVCFFSVSLFWL